MAKAHGSRFILTVLGRAGAGKSSLIRRLIRYGYLPAPIFVLDTMAEFRDGLLFSGPAELIRFVAEGRPNNSGIYVCQVSTDAEAARFWQFVRRAEMPCTIIVDEASKFCNPRQIQGELKELINYGRHWQSNLVLAARRPTELHRDVTAQSDAVVSFRQDEPNDVSALAKVSSLAQFLPDLDMPRPEDGQFIGEYVVMKDWQRIYPAPGLDPVRRA